MVVVVLLILIYREKVPAIIIIVWVSSRSFLKDERLSLNCVLQ